MNFFEGSTHSAICMYIFMLYVVLCYVCFPFEPGASFIQIVGSFSSYLEPLKTFFLVGSIESCEEFGGKWEILSRDRDRRIKYCGFKRRFRPGKWPVSISRRSKIEHIIRTTPNLPLKRRCCVVAECRVGELSRGQLNQRAANSRKTEDPKTDQFNASIISCRNTALFRARCDTKQGSLLIRWKH